MKTLIQIPELFIESKVDEFCSENGVLLVDFPLSITNPFFGRLKDLYSEDDQYDISEMQLLWSQINAEVEEAEL